MTMDHSQGDMTQEQLLPEQQGIPIIIKVLAFMLTLVLVFTAVANLLPQVEGQAPKEVKVDLSALTMDSYIAMGETLFKEKGTCTLCHNNLGRAPDMLVMDMVATANKRLAQADYKGDAKDAESYIMESMVAPSKYVVPGYGKPGEPSPMPVISKAPISLTDIEMRAIIAFLQAKDGGKPTVTLPTGDAYEAMSNKEIAQTTSSEPPKPAGNAEQVLSKYGCTACHAVLDSPSTIGPELKNIGARSSKAEIRESIINPSAVIAEGFPPIMPSDFADKMMVKELEMLVSYLSESKMAATDNSESINTEPKGE